MRKMRKITGTAYEILIELLYHFHNSKSGTCFPTYEQLAKQSGRHRSTVGRALVALERVKLLEWTRCVWRDAATGLPVNAANGYRLIDPAPKSQIELPRHQQTFFRSLLHGSCQSDPGLEKALAELKAAILGEKAEMSAADAAPA